MTAISRRSSLTLAPSLVCIFCSPRSEFILHQVVAWAPRAPKRLFSVVAGYALIQEPLSRRVKHINLPFRPGRIQMTQDPPVDHGQVRHPPSVNMLARAPQRQLSAMVILEVATLDPVGCRLGVP